jgi:hypothetical protein
VQPGGYGFTVDDLPCRAEVSENGDWVVTVIGVSVAKDESLANAIMDATGGIVDKRHAQAIAFEIASREAKRVAAAA